MTLFERFAVERKLRKLHGWLGALILPWIVIAGATGFYMNHERMVLSWFPDRAMPTAESFADDPRSRRVEDPDAALAVALIVAPESDLSLDPDRSRGGRDVFTYDTGPGEVIIDRETGLTQVRDRYRISYLAPDGTRLGSELRWGRILNSLHERGWVGTALGRWLADITAISLVVFGLSGLVLFYTPRLRRRRNRKARLSPVPPKRPAIAANPPHP